MSTPRLLVVAAHPDDEVLGCGGTIARFRDLGHDVRVIFLAEGITARYLPDQFDSDEVQERIARRTTNAYRAATVLNVLHDQVITSMRYCCRLDQTPQIDLVKEIEAHISEFQPSHLLTHAAYDTNVDHRMIHEAVLTAVRPYQKTDLRMVAAFEVLSSTEWNPQEPFHANIFVDISQTIDRKIEALARYEDEMMAPPHPRSESAIRGLAAYRGTQSGLIHAEAFSIIRSVTTTIP